ncbi:helix-turn-helix domain-containing protein [Streptomyces caniscabiei]|uniref:helix-turn-helix domain-containing protein n=1 Tax=Streptomyces caniscabiei TaxID=2746961 RepID=UPI0018728F87|nr:helix-turn-helix domain-containing protein [Streptomyces caniscabiei]MBE4735746.1 helix-turn-helix domain-containing protein [Streptomyces caniscabiei]
MRHCRIDQCPTPAAKGRRVCYRHQTRIRNHGDPHFHTWHVADDHDVQTVIQQQRPTGGLTRLERVLVAQGLTDLGLPAEEIARILAVTPRTVYRWRARTPA